MNVGNGEVIDACRKGGLGRFVNHSCAPNAETQKWVVRGELAIGMFATSDIKAGEEITFDYNFERYGDKPLRCLCGAPSCRGAVGGGGLDGYEFSSGDEGGDAGNDPEPIMVDAERAADPALAAVLEAEVGLAPGETPLGTRKKAAAGGPKKPKGADSDDEDYRDDGAAAAKGGRKGGKGGRRGADDSDDDDDSGDDAGNRRARRPARGAAGRRSGGGGRRRALVASAPRFARRSEVDRRLEALVGASGRLRDGNADSVVTLLRLFNLCDVQAAPGMSAVTGPAPADGGAAAGGRRRARLADLSLLLDVVLKSTSPSARRALADLGALRQLHAAALRCAAAPDAAPVLRKAVRAAAALPVAAAALHARSTAHGSFGDVLATLATTHADPEVRRGAGELLARAPPPGGWAAPPPPPAAPPRPPSAAALPVSPPSASVVARKPRVAPAPAGPTAELPPGVGASAARPAADAPPPPPLLMMQGAGGSWSVRSAPGGGAGGSWGAPAAPAPRGGLSAPPAGGPPPPPPPPPARSRPRSREADRGTLKKPATWGARAGWGGVESGGGGETGAGPARPAVAPDDAAPPDAFASPGARFEAFVSSFVAGAAREYARPDHPLSVSRADADAIAAKAAATIVRLERQAAAANEAAGAGKPIDRRRLEAKAADYVRGSVRRLHERRAGGGG